MNIHTTIFESVLSRCILFIGVPICAALMAALIMPAVAYSQTYSNPAPVQLLTAGTFGALAYSGITGSANVNGDGGTSTATIDAGITFTGTKYGVGHSYVLQAQADLAAALTNAAGRTNNATIAGDALGGLTLQRGVYGGGALDLAAGTTLTLDALGDPNAVFIIKAASTLTINTGSTVILANGAVWSNVFWYVGSSSTTITGSTFNGIILAVTSITLNAGSTVTARLLANTGAVTINSAVLPVELTSFTAILNKKIVDLRWDTATEVNNYGFNVERRSVDGNWNKIGFVQGHGNSNSAKQYSFQDKNFPLGIIQYRLMQIDFDGATEYSNIIHVKVESINQLTVYQNYPNPFNPTTVISFEIPVKNNVIVKVYNVLGNQVALLLNEEKLPGIYHIEFNASFLSTGVYFYSIVSGNTKPIIKKMILIK